MSSTAFAITSNAIKNIIVRELRDSFAQHPKFAKVTEYITSAFPGEERAQMGIILRDVSASLVKLSADNFVGTVVGHVALAKFKSQPGAFVEWVREDSRHIFKKTREDVSSQIDGIKSSFVTRYKPIVDPRTGEIQDVPLGVKGFLNGIEVLPIALRGKLGVVGFSIIPRVGDKFEIEYYFQDLVQAGFYILEMVTEDSFMVAEFLLQQSELITNDFDGTTLVYSLDHTNIVTGTFFVTLDRVIKLVEGVDYEVDLVNGIFTFTDPENLPIGGLIEVEYKFKGIERGPFPAVRMESDNRTLPGVVLAFGNQFQKGDKVMVVVFDGRTDIAEETGGRWDVSISLEVYARDSEQREQIADFISQIFWYEKKEKLDTEGISVVDVSMTGESEETYNPEQGSLYFKSGISLSLQTDWSMRKPIFAEATSVIALLTPYMKTLPKEIIGVVEEAEFKERHEEFKNFEQIR